MERKTGFLVAKYISLKPSFLIEVVSMNQKNFSGINDEEFHKEGTREMLLGLNYHLE